MGAKLYSDDAVAYNELVSLYAHEVVNHTREYVRGRVHTNGMENLSISSSADLNGICRLPLNRFVVPLCTMNSFPLQQSRPRKPNPLNDSNHFECDDFTE